MPFSNCTTSFLDPPSSTGSWLSTTSIVWLVLGPGTSSRLCLSGSSTLSRKGISCRHIPMHHAVSSPRSTGVSASNTVSSARSLSCLSASFGFRRCGACLRWSTSSCCRKWLSLAAFSLDWASSSCSSFCRIVS